MKKLLVLMLVLCLVPMASAALQISVGGSQTATEATVNVGSHLTLGIWTDSAISSGSTVWALVVQPASGTISGGSYVGPLGTYFDPAFGKNEDNFKGKIYSNTTGLLIPTGENGVQGTITVYYNGIIPDSDPEGSYPVIAANTNLFGSIDFLSGSVGDIVVHLYKFSTSGSPFPIATTGGTQDTLTIHQMAIPEPATMAILGLGGLLLRRKK